MNFHVDSGNESDVSPERELNLEPTPSPDEGLPSRSYSSELEDPGLDQPVGIPKVPDQEEEEDVLPPESLTEVPNAPTTFPGTDCGASCLDKEKAGVFRIVVQRVERDVTPISL